MRTDDEWRRPHLRRCILCGMSATRTQVYLTAEQRRRVDEIAARNETTMAAVIRTALDRYLRDGDADVGSVLAQTFGVDPAASAPDRDEWTNE